MPRGAGEEEGLGGDGVGEKRRSVSRDNDEEEMNDDTEDEEEVEAAMMAEDNEEYVWPYIKEIRLDNFMCHNHLKLELHREMNFIGGQNGSGKSAVLVALAMCLGAKSRDTERADSIKDFVGTFRDKAIIQVKLMQRPGDPVRSERLQNVGSELTIERTIPKSGGATYRILDSKGRKVSNKRDDVELIIEHLGLQVDNPIQVMQQTQSKTFLHSGKETKYYEFFFRATGLQDLHDIIMELERNYKQIQAEFASIEEKHAAWLKTDYKPASDDFEETKYLREMVQKVNALDVELVWAMVGEAEEKLRDVQDEVEQLDEKIKKGMTTFEVEKEKEIGLNEQLEQLKSRISSKSETAEAKEKRKSATEALRKHKNQVRQKEGEIRNLQKYMDELRSQIKSLEKEAIEAEKARAAAQGKKPASQLREYRAQLAQAQQDRDAAMKDKDRLVDIQADKDQEKQFTQKNVERARRVVEDAQDRVNAFAKSSQNNLNKFGPQVASIAESVKRDARKFSKPPIGPVGGFLKLKDERWRYALADACTDKVCQMYLGYTDQDVMTLRGMFQKTYQASAQRANTDNFNAKIYGDQKTLMDVLEIDHPQEEARLIIRNFLIDRVRINELRLADNYETASEMTNPRTSQPFTVTLDNGVRHTASKDTYYLEKNNVCERKQTCGKSVSQSKSLRTDRDVFSKDIKAQQRAAQTNLTQANQDLEQFHEAAKAAAGEANEARKDALAAMRTLKKLSDTIDDLERKVQEAEVEQQEEDDDPQSQFEVEIANLHQELNGKAQDKQDEEGSLEALKVACAAAEEVHHTIERELAHDEAEVKTYMQQYQRIEDERIKCAARLATHNKKENERKSTLNQKRDLARKQTSELESMKGGAQGMGERPEEMRSSEEVKKEQEKLKKLVANRQKEIQKDADKVERLYHKLHHIKAQREKECAAISLMIAAFKKARKARLKAFKKRRTNVSGMVSFEFRKYLSARNYTGDIYFDHAPKEGGSAVLRLQVDTTGRTLPDEPPTCKKSKKRKSGDDQEEAPRTSKHAASTSSVGKVKAMAPLLAMDEFDVFMDEKNRELCMTILCKEMREMHDRQLIVISPHTMAILGDGAADIKRITMKPIDRQQKALPYGRAAQ